MSTRRKWILIAVVLLAALTLAGVAVASELASTTFLPMVFKPSTPTFTPTPTVTPTPGAEVMITHIEADPKGPDLEGEFVTLKNMTSSKITMTGWKLKKNNSLVFTFPSFSLAAGAEVDVWSKDGKNDASNLYWGLSSAIWDNYHDCAYLYDDDGHEVHEYCYTR